MTSSDPGRERSLPHDPDLEVDEDADGEPLPVHLTPFFLGLVAIGGACGSLARYGVEQMSGQPDGLPVGTLTANLVGAFALGVLLEWLAVRGSDVTHRRAERLLLGTGFLGGFTTFSALAVESDGLLRDGRVGLAATYALGTVVLGLVSSLAGIAAVRAVAR